MGAETPDEHERLATLQAAAGRLLTQAAPDLTTVEQLAEQARVLAQSLDPLVASAAQRIELRLLGAALTGHSAMLRQLAQELLRAARWLPPEQSEQN